MAEKHKLKSLKRKIRRNAKVMVSKKVRQHELRERCGLTNANKSETDSEFDTDDEIDEDRNNYIYSESDTYQGDENVENIPSQIIDDNNAISDEENSGDSHSNCSADASSEQNDDREEIVINENLENLHDSFSNSDSEHNVYVGNIINFNNIPVGTQHDRDVYILRTLKEWALRGVSRKKINDLLFRLQPIFPVLPKSYKTLLKTPRKVPLKVIGTGKMWYKGIQVNIRQKLSDAYVMDKGEIVMDVNIDGLNLYDSTDGEFWPILGSFSDVADPFIIGVYYGNKKPEDINMFLEDFVAEVEELNENGFELDGIFYPFRIRNYILDVPARAFIKQCMGHTGRFSCEKSVITSKPSTVQLVKAELLQEMSSKIDILLINQERILRKLFPGEQAVVRPKNLPQLPLQTHEAFNAFQKFLQSDINFDATVDYFASFSRADTEKSAVGKLLPKIISNKLARILNWTGSGTIKLGIEGTLLHEALQCAILKNFPQSNLQAATGSMKRWFHTSNQRKV